MVEKKDNMSNHHQEIKDLEDKITELKKQEALEFQNKVIPFLQKNSKCIYSAELSRLYLSFNSKESNKAFIEILSKASGNSGFHHFGVSVDDHSHIRYDDDEISISFNFSGKTGDNLTKLKNKLKDLNLKIDFSDAKNVIQNQISKLQKKLDEMIELENNFSK